MSKVINGKEFQKDVLNHSGAILVDFFTEWCGPCKMLAPALEELSREMKGKAKVFKVDIGKNGDLAQRYGIMSVPTLMIFKNGVAVDKMVGFQPKQQLRYKLEQYSK
jgi:thioredoxin 1